jgi:hypothetical protein
MLSGTRISGTRMTRIDLEDTRAKADGPLWMALGAHVREACPGAEAMRQRCAAGASKTPRSGIRRGRPGPGGEEPKREDAGELEAAPGLAAPDRKSLFSGDDRYRAALDFPGCSNRKSFEAASR